MNDVTVEITDKSGESFKKVEQLVEKFMLRVLLKITKDAQQIIRDKKAYATLEMYRNIRYEIVREAAKIIGVAGVGSNVSYAIYRHEGTRAHWPPQLAIQQWILKKGILSSGSQKISQGFLRKHSGKARGNEAVDQVKTLAFLIARKISKKGTQGLPFLRMALNQNLEYITSQLAEIKFT